VRTKYFSILLAISLVMAFIVPIVAASNPVVPNPEYPNWVPGVWWGTKLRLENTYFGESWFGAGAADSSPQAPSPPTGYLVGFIDENLNEDATLCYAVMDGVAPGGGVSDNWQVIITGYGAVSSTAPISSVMGDVDNDYVPQDYSVVLDNSAAGILINLRAGSGTITGIGPVYATLYVDNAVNITNVASPLDPTTGNAGDPLTLSVTVKNTGRYTDTYSVSANAGSVSTGALAAGNSATVSVPATYPLGTQGILVTAAGSYAKDEDSSLVLTGVQSIVFRAYDTGYATDNISGIAPWKLYGLGDNAPIMVAKKIGAGAVVASSWNGGTAYYRSTSYPSADNMDVLFDITFQWMVPGATKILWFDGDSVYSSYKTTGTTTKKMLDNLRVKKGYTIDNGNLYNFENLYLYKALGYDILVINQEQLGNKLLGGDPSLLTSTALDNIKDWVDSGKGVIVQEVGDYQNYCYNRVSNAILDKLNFGWWFQHDCIYDDTRNDLAANYKPLVVRVVGNPIGDNYAAQTGRENILAYKCPTLIPRPTITATVDVPDTSATEGTPGVTVTVPVTNSSTVWNNFSIGVSDTLGWITGFAPSVTGILAPSASTNVTVTVNVGAAPLVDLVTVTATSFDDGSVFSDSGTVTAISKLAAVDVEILPGEYVAHCSVVDTLIDPCYRYDPLTFTVKVSNIGALDDKYELTVTGVPEGMGLKLTPDELFVPSGDTEYASLSVTLPDSWLGGVSGTVTVTAVGMLSSENQEPLYPTDNDSVVVIAGIENSVQKEILPDTLEPQTGAPGSPLVWLIVLKNTGNIPETLTLTVNDIATGVSSASTIPRTPGWGATIDNLVFQSVAPCTKVITYLRVTVPSDAKTSEWDTIFVTVDDGMGVTDTENVRAHAVEPGPRIPEGVIEISVEAQVIAIEVWPNTWDFGVLDEDKTGTTDNDYFTVRNTGNVNEKIQIKGTDAQSMPGEPVATWTLDDVSIGLDQYMMWVNPVHMALSKSNQDLVTTLIPGTESMFGLEIQAPSAISTPARMWARVKLTAIMA